MNNMEMKYFRHKITGIVGQFPAHFADYDYMEEVDSNDVPCCGADEPVFLEPPEINDEPEADKTEANKKKGRDK